MSYALVLEVPNARAVEAETHRLLDANRGRGEWFDVPPDIAIDAVYEAKEKLYPSYSAREPKSKNKLPLPFWLCITVIVFVVFFLINFGSQTLRHRRRLGSGIGMKDHKDERDR